MRCPFAPGVADEQIPASVGFDLRTPRLGDPFGQTRQTLPRQLVVHAGRLARRPGDLRVGVPVFDAALVVGDLLPGNADRTAAREAVSGALVVPGSRIDPRVRQLAARIGQSAACPPSPSHRRAAPPVSTFDCLGHALLRKRGATRPKRLRPRRPALNDSDCSTTGPIKSIKTTTSYTSARVDHPILRRSSR